MSEKAFFLRLQAEVNLGNTPTLGSCLQALQDLTRREVPRNTFVIFEQDEDENVILSLTWDIPSSSRLYNN